jgi:hypothetical protein
MHNLPAWDIKSKPHTCRSQDSTKIPCVWGMHPIRRKRRRSNQWSLPGRLSGLTNSMHVLVLAGRPRGGRRRTSLVISPTRAARATLGARATVRTGRSTAALSVSKTYNRGVAYHGLAAGWWISGLLNGFGQVGGRRSATGGRVSWQVRAEDWGVRRARFRLRNRLRSRLHLVKSRCNFTPPISIQFTSNAPYDTEQKAPALNNFTAWWFTYIYD